MPEHTQTICTHKTCDLPIRCSGYCTKHYQQLRKRGYTYDLIAYEVCQADACDLKTRSKYAQYCETHYYRFRRNGTLDTIQPRVPQAACVVAGCKRPAERTDGLCRGCLDRLQRNGSFDYIDKKQPDELTTYTAVHRRLRTRNGSARNYSCVDCGGRAHHWSYNHQDPTPRYERVGRHPRPVPFSPNLACYEPRCASCHRRFDLRNIKEGSV